MKFDPRRFNRPLALFFTFLIIFEAAAFVATTPRPKESFFELYVLGANGLAGDYYPNNSSFIQLDELVTWQIGIANQMGSVQFVEIQVKLANQTINPPNDTTSSPSPAPLVTEFKHFAADNGTWEFPFVWEILNVTTQGGRSRIFRLQIDQVTYVLTNSPTCSNPSSCEFRFIFELWTWSDYLNDFQIGWLNGDQRRIAWLQLWFYLTPGVP